MKWNKPKCKWSFDFMSLLSLSLQILFIVNFLVYKKFEKTFFIFFVKVKNLEIFVWNNDKSSLKCIEKNKNN